MHKMLEEKLIECAKRIRDAEKIAQPGSIDHYRFVAARLHMEWPTIDAAVKMIEEKRRNGMREEPV